MGPVDDRGSQQEASKWMFRSKWSWKMNDDHSEKILFLCLFWRWAFQASPCPPALALHNDNDTPNQARWFHQPYEGPCQLDLPV